MKEFIEKIIELAYKSKEGHIGSSLYVLDFLHCDALNINYEELFNTMLYKYIA